MHEREILRGISFGRKRRSCHGLGLKDQTVDDLPLWNAVVATR